MTADSACRHTEHSEESPTSVFKRFKYLHNTVRTCSRTAYESRNKASSGRVMSSASFLSANSTGSARHQAQIFLRSSQGITWADHLIVLLREATKPEGR